MRTIKFRGKRIDDGEWIYGYLADVQEQYGYATIDYVFDDGEEYWESCDHVDVNTVGQFTGLHDKNGKEIYEGDIIGKQESNHYLEVRYIDGMFRLFGLDDVTGFGSIPAYYLMDENNFVLEIVGNIHDNFELLKGGEE